MSCHVYSMNIKNLPQGRERKCKADDLSKQGGGLPWGGKALAPAGESRGRQLRAPQGALGVQVCVPVN